MTVFQIPVLTTKLIPPRVKSHFLWRKRLQDKLTQVVDYPLTIL